MNNASCQPIALKKIKKLLIGQYIDVEESMETSQSYLINIQTMWQDFMQNNYPKLKSGCVDNPIVSIEERLVGSHGNKLIRKWAAVEIANQQNAVTLVNISEITIQGAYYGFMHIGVASQFHSSLMMAYHYLAENNMMIDIDKPRFEVMDNHYLPNNPHAKEIFWLPIKR